MGVSWTKEQQKVIDLRGCSILVSAAAGSGKTAVLVERIIAMLTAKEHPVSVDELLIVTFTEAAAAEMKERIRRAIEEELMAHPEDEHLMRQATLIHNAQITTIHSFCLSVIRDHFHVIDLDPGFRVGEEGELKLLRHDVLGELLEERYGAGEQEFFDFVTAYGTGRDDRKVEEVILKIYEFSRSYPDAQGWLDSCVEAYHAASPEEFEESFLAEFIKENTRRYLEDAYALTKQGLTVCTEPDGPAAYEATLLSDQQMIEEILAAGSFRELSEKMQGVTFARLAANRDKTVSEEKISFVKAVRDEVKGLVGDASSQYFYQDMDGLLEDLALCEPKMKVLADLVAEFAKRFEEKKRERDLIDFSDMEQYALRILTEQKEGELVPSAVAREYQQQFFEIMIDEYQDSNFLQEAILTSISGISQGRYNIFMVGDVKQSIYRFRLSRPELFMEKFDTYSLVEGEKQRIDLHKNFRSRKEVLESVNYIFRQIMTKPLGGIVYDSGAALYVGADYPECVDIEGETEESNSSVTEVLVIDSDMEGEPEGQVTERELEARAIAGRIRELIRKFQVADKETGRFRPVKYSDIVILTRSVKGSADIFIEVLTREGIPAYAGTREGYFKTQEIGVLLDYLRALDNAYQDIPLAAVLASPFGGLTEQEMAVVKSAYGELPFHRAVFAYREEGKDEALKGKLENCLGKMEKIREQVPYTPMHELLRKIFADTGYREFVSSMPGGQQRQANLEMLLEKAKAFEATSYRGLFHFVRYIEQLQKYDVDYGEAALNDEQSDTVRVMTIHKSKGLEFPIVFVSGLGKRFNMQDARSSVVLHAGLGVGLDAVDIVRRTKSPSIVKKVIQKEETLDALGEELRVLYVALTRAKEKLILTGTISNLEKRMENYGMVKSQETQQLSFGRLSKASIYWDWLLPALLRLTPEIPVRVRVLTFEDIVKEEVEEETAGRITKAALEAWDAGRVYDDEVRKHLERQFGYSYPYAGSRMQKLKFTVSELKKRVHFLETFGEGAEDAVSYGEVVYEEPEVVPLIPRFLQGETELTGASKGTAYHRILELLDFRKEYTEEMLKADIETFQREGKISEEMADAVRVSEIMRFLVCSVGRRMRECALKGTLKKEQPFVLGVDAREIYPEEQEGEEILVQGIIDVYFEELDGLVVLDYKTDRVMEAGELIDRYHAQLDYYAKALERLTRKKVKEKIIYSFALREEIIL